MQPLLKNLLNICYAVNCSWFNFSLCKIYSKNYIRKYGKMWIRKIRIQAIFYTVYVSDPYSLSRWNLMRQYSMASWVYSEPSQKYKIGLVAKLIHKSHFRSANYTFFIRSILFKTSLLKSNFSLWKLLHDFATTAINYVSLSLWSLSKDFFTIQETACSWFI